LSRLTRVHHEAPPPGRVEPCATGNPPTVQAKDILFANFKQRGEKIRHPGARLSEAGDIDAAFARPVPDKVQAIFIPGSPTFNTYRKRVEQKIAQQVCRPWG
jgi:hypothetical protein